MANPNEKELLSWVEKAFYTGAELDQELDIFAEKDWIKEGYDEKERFEPVWRRFINELEGKEWGRVRDMSSAGEMHSYVGFPTGSVGSRTKGPKSKDS
jgi:hypothetical protein